ncbi:Dihydrolipoamide acetyltransferase component of pyruvate dehydrogenase complex [hydrothermal vent metagenome]|uniref:Dihydrolipoamide acetyltransferase component of pyruvate dehydrogenase complex n=1 Tax=hydrothermal vent metagenome TaxID=652676 RepID=A0A3B0UKJ1_9ZZZZ
MAEFIKMPTLGFDMEEGTMGTWLKQVGDSVSKGDLLAEIESDKVTQELAARAEGVLLAQLASTGDLIPVGENLGIIGAAGEDIEAMVAQSGGDGDESAPAAVPEVETPVLSRAEAAVPQPTEPTQTAPATNGAQLSEFPGGVKATPVARRLAAEHGVDLARIAGSGPGGRVRKADVEAAIANPPAVQTVHVETAVSTTQTSTEKPLTRMRKAIARRMAESKVTVPHFYITSDIDMAKALELRKQINAALPPEQKVSVNDLVVKAVGLTLRDFPNINASFAGDKIILHEQINVGTAVAVEGGLLTVVQKGTDGASISKIAQDHKEMIGRAREGKVQAADVDGATFTVSNLGAFDVDHFIAIINPPNAAILAVGSAAKVPVVVNGELTIGTRMKATISADHRITDGVEAAQFMQTLKAILQEPLRLLL